MQQLLQRAHQYQQRQALADAGSTYTYAQLLNDSRNLAARLKEFSLEGLPVASFISPGYVYVVAQWTIWRSGGMAVPLCIDHPPDALKHVLVDTDCKLILVENDLLPKIKGLVSELKIQVIDPEQPSASATDHRDTFIEEALILYTSGSTSLPKGVVITHTNLVAQMNALSQAWQWDQKDVILNVLPLHHVHGIVNVLCCALWNGAECRFLEKFTPAAVFQQFSEHSINLFMAVPTIYFKLIQFWQSLDPSAQHQISQDLKAFRLMVSGSAALPVETLQQWEKISGHRLLERYGMTEIGMALSNPYDDVRHAGHVGWPLPGVELRLHNPEMSEQDPTEGELWIKGPSVFKEYWKQPQLTSESFHKGWFKTGDLAAFTPKGYRILGRLSTDIIKSGGYKISALEIEDAILSHPLVEECAVVGLADREWGEIAVAALVIASEPPSIPALEQLLLTKLPKYKKPREYYFIEELPRNALGKVVKPQLKKILRSLRS